MKHTFIPDEKRIEIDPENKDQTIYEKGSFRWEDYNSWNMERGSIMRRYALGEMIGFSAFIGGNHR